MDERRSHERYVIPTLDVRIQDVERFRRVHLRNISEGGIFIRTQNLIPEDSEVRVRIHSPAGTSVIELKGCVLRHETGDTEGDSGMAIAFFDMPAGLQDKIAALLAECEASAPGAITVRPRPIDAGPDNLRGELEKLRATVRAAHSQLRVIHSEIDNYEEIDASRRVLLEHLVFQKKAFESAREVGTSAEQRQIEMLDSDIAGLEAELWPSAQEEALRQTIAQLHASVDAQRRRGHDLSQKHSDLVAVHAQAIAAAAQRREQLGEDLAAAREQVAQLRVRPADEHEQGSRQVQELAAELESIRAATAAIATEDHSRDQLAELAQTRDAIAAETQRVTDLDNALSRAEDSRKRLRSRVREAEHLVSLLSAKTSSEGGAAEASDAGSLDFDPHTDLDLDSVLRDEPDAAGEPVGLDVGTHTDAEPDTDPGDAVPDADSDDAPLLDEGAFAKYLAGGGRLVRTKRFNSVEATNELESTVCRLLERADTLPEILGLAPRSARKKIVQQIYNFYRAQLLTIAADDGALQR